MTAEAVVPQIAHQAQQTARAAEEKLQSGTVKALWRISFPLMLSLLSGSLMLFFDRLFLANYSIDALNASTNASAIAATLQFGFISTTCIAEVFVGRYNGAKKYHRVGQPVWQMIWFSLMTILLFFPLAFFSGSFLFADSPYREMEADYFKWLMLFGPVFAVVGALSAFYIGRGKVAFITLIVILANTVNVVLDIVLIYGYEPYIKSIGMNGAAVATGISQLFQATILFAEFLRRKNREKYGTGNCVFVWRSFKKCLKIGLPNSMAHTIEIFAWAVFYKIMTAKGVEYITVAAITQSIYFLFTFITEGISKGATALASNMIGAKKWDDVWRLFRSGVKFYIQVFLVMGVFLVFDPEPLINLFLPAEQGAVPESVKLSIQSALVWVWIFFLFEGINWLVVGLLTAAGDTRFIFMVSSLTVWIFAIIPIYVGVVMVGYTADMAWMMTAVYGILTCCIYIWRFKSEKWKLEEV